MLVQFLLWFTFFISLSFILLDSVLLIGVMSLVFSLFLCCLVSVFFSSWFSIISVVVYVGGLLVMFSYFLAVCPNQTMLGKSAISGVIFLVSILFSLSSTIFFVPDIGAGLTDLDILYKSDEGGLLIFLAVLLLYALLSVVSIVSLSSGPLRPFAVA